MCADSITKTFTWLALFHQHSSVLQADRDDRELVEPPKLGKNKYKPGRVHVLATEDVTGSLRRLKTVPAVARDRFNSLQKRGAVQVRTASDLHACTMWATVLFVPLARICAVQVSVELQFLKTLSTVSNLHDNAWRAYSQRGEPISLGSEWGAHTAYHAGHCAIALHEADEEQEAVREGRVARERQEGSGGCRGSAASQPSSRESPDAEEVRHS